MKFFLLDRSHEAESQPQMTISEDHLKSANPFDAEFRNVAVSVAITSSSNEVNFILTERLRENFINSGRYLKRDVRLIFKMPISISTEAETSTISQASISMMESITAGQLVTAPAPSFGSDSLTLHMPSAESYVSMLRDSPLTTPDFANYIRSVEDSRNHSSTAGEPQTADIVKAVMEIQAETNGESNLLMPPPMSTSLDRLHHHQQQQHKNVHHQQAPIPQMIAAVAGI